MDKYKNYQFYKGEESCPFTDQHASGMWCIEEYHSFHAQDTEWLKNMVDIMSAECPELAVWEKGSNTAKEVTALCIQSMIEGGYTHDKIITLLKDYGSR